ncbi:MAG: DUF2062 domain-containing protein [Bacteroidota bacterium]
MIKKKIIDPLIGFLKQGISPSSLAWAITAGVVIAYIPFFGISTVLCLFIIWLFRLNPAVVLLANQVAYPLQFILYLPFLRIGEWLFGAPKVPFSASQIFKMAKEDLWGVIKLLWQSTVYGVVVWIVISIPVAFILYYILKAVISRFSAARLSETSPRQ